MSFFKRLFGKKKPNSLPNYGASPQRWPAGPYSASGNTTIFQNNSVTGPNSAHFQKILNPSTHSSNSAVCHVSAGVTPVYFDYANIVLKIFDILEKENSESFIQLIITDIPFCVQFLKNPSLDVQKIAKNAGVDTSYIQNPHIGIDLMDL